MSTRSMLIMLVIAVGLAAAALWALRGGSTAEEKPFVPPEWVRRLNADGVSTLQATYASGETLTLSKRDLENVWMLSRSGTDGRGIPGSDWPVRTEMVGGGLTLIAEGIRKAEPWEDEVSKDADRVTIRGKDGAARELLIGAAALGGKSPLTLREQGKATPLLADARLRDLLMRESMLAWRDTAAFPKLGPGRSRITVRNALGDITMSRQQSVWQVESLSGMALGVAASEQVMDDLLKGIETLTIDRFRDSDPPPPGDWWHEGEQAIPTTLRFTVEQTLRLVVGENVERRRIAMDLLREGSTVGTDADAVVILGAREISLDGSASKQIWGPIRAQVRASSLNRLEELARAAISPRPLQIAPADLSSVTLLRAEGGSPIAQAGRVVRGWTWKDDAPGPGGVDAAGFAALLTEPAAGVVIPDASVVEELILEARSVNGDSVRYSVLRAANGPRLLGLGSIAWQPADAGQKLLAELAAATLETDQPRKP